MALRSELCADESLQRDEPQHATASRVEHWLLVEYGGRWPYDPLDAPLFAGALRDRLAEQLAALPRSRLLLVRRPRTRASGPLTVFYGRTLERGSRFFRLDAEAPEDLEDVDFADWMRDGGRGESLDHPLLLVCVHGKRDRCCARYGQPLYDRLCRLGHTGWTWMATHVGGDRFAGNLVCLPEGLYFGRVGGAAAEPLLASYLDGRVDADHYRGRSCYPFPAQAAEAHVRRAKGLFGLTDLRLVGATPTDRGWSVRFEAEVAGVVHEVDVERRLDPAAYLTCRAEVARPVPRFVAFASRVLAA
jgi:hypothetical protein